MRKGTVKRCFGAGLVFCLVTGLVTGCSKKEQTVDYNIEEETESDQNNANKGKTGLIQFASSTEWKDEWTTVNTKKNTVQLTVEASIIVPDIAQMSVVEVEEPEFDEGYKKRVAEHIFEEGDIYYNDISHLPKKELEELRIACQEAYDSYSGTDEDQKEELERELSDYDEALKTAKDTYSPADTYDVDKYMGERDGITYELFFSEKERCYDAWDRFIECRGKEIGLTAKDIRQVCPEELSEAVNLTYWTSMDDITAENQCAISVEDAQKLAQRFVDKLDLDYTVCGSYRPLTWAEVVNMYQVEESCIVDGYVFYFDVGVDDLSFVTFGTQENYRTFNKKRDSEESRYFMKTRMEVFVTEKGVIEMRAYNPLEITRISGGVGLAPLEDIKAIMKERLTEDIGFFRLKYSGTDWMQFNELELIYFRIRDKESPGHYSYVPTWRLAHVYDRKEVGLSWEGHDAYRIDLISPVLVNAIDGSVIDFYDEV